MQINHTHNFCRFEESMKEADIAKKEWPLRLRPLLTSKGLSAYTHDVSEEAKEDYDVLKESLLNAVDEFYAHGKRSSLSWPDAVRHVEFIANRLMQECTSRQECVKAMTLARPYSWCPPDCAALVRLSPLVKGVPIC